VKNLLYRLLDHLTTRPYVRKCTGCDDPQPHTAHLTRLGRWHYIDRFAR
jgi:hypothetical protein